MNTVIRASILSALLIGSTTTYASNESASYDDALVEFNKGNVQDSYLLLKHVLKDTPENLPAKLLMGRILLLNGYIKESIEELEEVLLAGGDKNLVLPPLSRAYLLDGQYDKIFTLLKRNTLSSDARLSVTLVVGTAHVRLNQLEQARALYEDALTRHPDNVSLLNALANLMLDINEAEEAEQLVTHALEIEAKNPFLLITLGKLKDMQGQPSLATYKKAYDIDTDNPATMRAYASALAEEQQFEKASTIIAKIEEQTPGDVQNQLIKARILALTQQQFEADKILKSLADKLSLLTEKQLNERIELSLITGIVAYLNKNYSLASTELYRYIGKRDATAEQLSMLADAMIKTSNYKDASNLLDKYEDKVISHLPLARLYCELNLAMKRTFKCEQILPELERRYAGDINFSILTVKLLLNSNQIDQARTMLNTDLANSDHEEVIRLKIGMLSQQEDFEQALALTQKLLDRQPDSLGHRALLTDLLIRTNKLGEAKRSIEILLKSDEQNIAGLIAKARVAFHEKQWSTANEAIEAAIKQDKTNAAARILAAQIYLAQSLSEKAVDHLLAAKTLDSKDIESRQLLIKVYQQEGDLQAALSEINTLINIDRLSADYHLQKAAVLNEIGDTTAARAQLNMVYALWSEAPLKLLTLAHHQLTANDISGAEKSYLMAIKRAPKARQPHLEYASFLIAQKRFEDAANRLDEFANRFGKTSNLAMLRGDLANAQDDSDIAFDAYMVSLERSPSFQQPLIKAFELARKGTKRSTLINYLSNKKSESNRFYQHLLADLYFVDNQPAHAEEIYLELLTDESLPNKAFLLNNLANIYAKHDADKALKYVEDALALQPNSAALMDTKGWLLSLNDDYQQGLSLLRQAYTLDSSDPSVQYHIAYTLNKLGRQEEARAILQKHQTLNKTFREQPDAQTLMQSL